MTLLCVCGLVLRVSALIWGLALISCAGDGAQPSPPPLWEGESAWVTPTLNPTPETLTLMALRLLAGDEGDAEMKDKEGDTGGGTNS